MELKTGDTVEVRISDGTVIQMTMLDRQDHDYLCWEAATRMVVGHMDHENHIVTTKEYNIIEDCNPRKAMKKLGWEINQEVDEFLRSFLY